jgi:hypothetical protein
MNASENDFLHAAIGAKLASIVAASSAQPAWHEDWKRLEPKATEDELVYATRKRTASGKWSRIRSPSNWLVVQTMANS